MFLKTELFEYNGVSVTLSELSALQRFDYMKFVSDAERQEITEHDVVRINQLYLETASLLVAMSLWHTHSLKGTLVSPETEMQQIRREVMLGWPADALNQATNRVLYLSGMQENRSDAAPERTGKAEAAESVTAKKCSKTK
ncbi:phage minor tail protein G [Escherichia coli]|uniref:phage tail assembly chaperone G n=1 Tax=Escherichia coli TaxID=562 RepID=UPI00107F576A|nr:phage minor tail protein G [Escherichia coli]EFE9645039.1 phage minor tail protein G [Escherichia coli]EFH3711722.1 phage minor tail protein G [Escherichia coli]EFM6377473.1 phage minor tail protein G [Escherichia coli]EFM6391562.1 phage minor tail protein G [Escherichia coli]EFM6406410.1 phage minor tail protein G [Escherichia coli]